jgi:hypothetical protein
MEELSIKKLTPGTSKKKEKDADKKLGMNTLMAQIAERRKALTEEGNILRKDKAIDESIMEHHLAKIHLTNNFMKLVFTT